MTDDIREEARSALRACGGAPAPVRQSEFFPSTPIPDETVDWFAEWRWGPAYYTKARSEALLSRETRRTIEHQSDQMRERARAAISELLTKVALRPLLDQEAVAEALALSRAIRDGDPGLAWNYLQDAREDATAVLALLTGEASQ